MAIGAARVGEYGRARQHLERAYRRSPHDVRVLFWQAMVAQETSQAIVLLQRAARFAPRHPIVRRELWSRRLGRLPDSPDQPAGPRTVARLAREWAGLERRGSWPPLNLVAPLVSTVGVLVLVVGLVWMVAQREARLGQGELFVTEGPSASVEVDPGSEEPGTPAASPSNPRLIREIPTELSSEEAGNIVYTVQEGDSLQSIAARYGVTVESLMRENNLRDHWIYPGQELIVPTTEGPGPAE